MSGRVQLDKYMHFPTMAQYGSSAASLCSSLFFGHISFVRRNAGQGVLTELQFSIRKSVRIWVVYCSWSIMSSRWSLHLLLRQPSSHSVSPPSVIANFCFIWEAARSDSALELEAMRRSSTLVADMVTAEGVFRMYTLQSDWHLVNPSEE